MVVKETVAETIPDELSALDLRDANCQGVLYARDLTADLRL